jgi:hypothetical protein
MKSCLGSGTHATQVMQAKVSHDCKERRLNPGMVLHSNKLGLVAGLAYCSQGCDGRPAATLTACFTALSFVMQRRYDWLASLELVVCGAAHATDNACLIETKTQFSASMPADLLADLKAQYGDTLECSEGRGLTGTQLKDQCKGWAASADDLLKSMNAKATRKITYHASCTKPFQGSCDGVPGMPFASFYYKHAAKDLDTAKKSCAASGGKWVAGTLK